MCRNELGLVAFVSISTALIAKRRIEAIERR